MYLAYLRISLRAGTINAWITWLLTRIFRTGLQGILFLCPFLRSCVLIIFRRLPTLQNNIQNNSSLLRWVPIINWYFLVLYDKNEILEWNLFINFLVPTFKNQLSKTKNSISYLIFSFKFWFLRFSVLFKVKSCVLSPCLSFGLSLHLFIRTFSWHFLDLCYA